VNFGRTGLHPARLTYSRKTEPLNVRKPATRNSPAEHAGINKGDVVVNVNGRQMTGLSLNELRRQLRGDVGNEQRFTVLRGEREITVRFLLQDNAD